MTSVVDTADVSIHVDFDMIYIYIVRPVATGGPAGARPPPEIG